MKILKFFLILFLYSSLLYSQNSKFELENIRFNGNNHISSKELYDVILSKESPNWFSQFVYSFSNLGEPAVNIDTNKIGNDIEYIRRYYQSKGFFKVEVKGNYFLDSLANKSELVYLINEGQESKFKSLEINGLEHVPGEFKDEIAKYTEIDTTDNYSDDKILIARDRVLNLLNDNGFMLAKADLGVVKIDTLTNSVSSRIDFNIGKRYQIDSILVVKSGPGKDLVDESLLKSIVNINKGDFYSYYDIQQGQVRLYRTNLFSSALVSGLVSDTSEYHVPLQINADIGLLNDISPEILMNDEDGVFNFGLGVSYSRKNFLGGARQFSLGVSAASQDIEFLTKFDLSDTTLSGYADARITLEQPYFFGKPINTKYELYTTLQKRRNEWNAVIFGAKVNFDFELPRFTYLNSFSSYLIWENSKFIYREAYYFSAIEQFLSEILPPSEIDSVLNGIKNNLNLESETNNTVLGFDFGANKTNDFLFPTSGYYLNLVLEDGNTLAHLIGKAFNSKQDLPLYEKVLFTAATFKGLFNSDKSAIGMKLKVGNIFTLSGNKSTIPFNQRFYAGGSNSVRGWRTRELVPPDPDIDIDNITNDDLQDFLFNNITPGGFFLLEASIEARLNITGALGSSIFVDVGNTFNSFKNLRFDLIAAAAGFGVRYYSTFAPLRLDFGFKVYDPYDNRPITRKNFGELFELHFGIGEAF